MCSLRRPFEAENLKALVQKVYTGRYASIPSNYSRELQDMVAMLLQVDPARRPNIADILEMSSVTHRMNLVPFNDSEGVSVAADEGASGSDVRLRSTIKVPRVVAVGSLAAT